MKRTRSVLSSEPREAEEDFTSLHARQKGLPVRRLDAETGSVCGEKTLDRLQIGEGLTLAKNLARL